MGVLSTALLLAISIQAPGTCPTGADVERQLAPLLPPGFESATPDVAAIDENADGSLTLSLARFDQGTIVRRRLPRAQSCADQAQTVAVTLAVWEAQIHPEISLRLDRLLPARTPVAEVPVAPDRDALVLRASPPAPTGGTPIALGAGFAGAWQPDSFAPAGRIDLMFSRTQRPWRARLSVVGLGPHGTSLPPGQATWWRLYLALGADASIGLGRRWALVAGAAGVVGALRLMGSGYTDNRRVWNTDVGAEFQARVEWRAGRVRPWLGLALVTWLRSQTLEVTGADSSPALPRAEPMAALGADFIWGQ